jgi:hypothetical protein
MSNEKIVNNAATAADPPVAGAPAPEAQTITPEALVEQLRVLRAQIPEYVQLAVPEARALRGAANVHPDFAQAAINAVGASQRVESTVGKSADELQTIAETTARWSPVEDELRAMLGGVSSANLTRRHTLAQAALLTYAVSKKLVKSPEHANLLPHLAQMRRTNRLGRNSKSAAKPQPQAPAPKPEPSPSTAPSTKPVSNV